MTKKMAGFNFLHRHSHLEGLLKVDAEHVIVDRKDWEEVVYYLQSHSQEVEKIGNIQFDLEIGGIIEERDGNKITKFNLQEVSVVSK